MAAKPTHRLVSYKDSVLTQLDRAQKDSWEKGIREARFWATLI